MIKGLRKEFVKSDGQDRYGLLRIMGVKELEKRANQLVGKKVVLIEDYRILPSFLPFKAGPEHLFFVKGKIQEIFLEGRSHFIYFENPCDIKSHSFGDIWDIFPLKYLDNLVNGSLPTTLNHYVFRQKYNCEKYDVVHTDPLLAYLSIEEPNMCGYLLEKVEEPLKPGVLSHELTGSDDCYSDD